MADIKLNDLPTAISMDDAAVLPFSQEQAGTPTSFKMPITDIGAKIAEDLTFSNLQTAHKTLVEAINDAATGSGGTAEGITYNNTDSGLTATNVQDAIDEVNNKIPKNADFTLSGLSDTTITTPSSGQVLSYDGGKWKNVSPSVVSTALGGGNSTTIACDYGTIIFMSRQSINHYAVYMLDGTGTICPIIETHPDITFSYAGGILTISNTTTSGRQITVIKP